MSVISILRNPGLNQRERDVGLGKHGLKRGQELKGEPRMMVVQQA